MKQLLLAPSIKGGDFPGGTSGKKKTKKNLFSNSGGVRDISLICGTERSPGGRHGNPSWYSCLENPMEKGAWCATVHRVTKSQTQLE